VKEASIIITHSTNLFKVSVQAKQITLARILQVVSGAQRWGHNFPGGESLRRAPKSPKNVYIWFRKSSGGASDFEHGGTRLASYHRRHLTSLRPWAACHLLRILFLSQFSSGLNWNPLGEVACLARLNLVNKTCVKLLSQTEDTFNVPENCAERCSTGNFIRGNKHQRQTH